MMVQLRWKCPPQALLLLILVHGHLFVLLQVQLLLRMGGTRHVYNSDFSGLWKGNLAHTLHAIPSVESGAISYNQAHLHLVAKHMNIHNRDDK